MTRAAVRIASEADADAARALLARGGATLVDDAAQADLLVVDEWTPAHDPTVLQALGRGARVTTLAEGILAMAEGPVVAITGTAGKSSTAHALGHLLRATGWGVRMSTSAPSANAWPDAAIADRPARPDEVLVAELTSTHLAHMAIPCPPDVVVVTLIRPDHLDLHLALDAYIGAKRTLALAQEHGQPIVIPADDHETVAALGAVPGLPWGFGHGDPGTPGAWFDTAGAWTLRDARGGVAHHDAGPQPEVQRRAIAAAASAAMALGVSARQLASHLEGVPQPPHRQRLAGRFRDAWIIDDTMAATPRKARAGIDAVAPRDPVLVLGGNPDGHDPAEVAAELAHVGQLGLRVVAFGPQADRVARSVPVIGTAPTVMGALAMAATAAGRDGTVLVCPMFPMTAAERDRVAALPEA